MFPLGASTLSRVTAHRMIFVTYFNKYPAITSHDMYTARNYSGAFILFLALDLEFANAQAV
jgi:hypothetical protein